MSTILERPRTTGWVGRPVDRIDGHAKVTGAAPYAADAAIESPLHAVLVQSTIPRGRIVAIDETAARALPGVVEVLTHANAPLRSGAAVRFRHADERAARAAARHRDPLRRSARRGGDRDDVRSGARGRAAAAGDVRARRRAGARRSDGARRRASRAVLRPRGAGAARRAGVRVRGQRRAARRHLRDAQREPQPTRTVGHRRAVA